LRVKGHIFKLSAWNLIFYNTHSKKPRRGS